MNACPSAQRVSLIEHTSNKNSNLGVPRGCITAVGAISNNFGGDSRKACREFFVKFINIELLRNRTSSGVSRPVPRPHHDAPIKLHCTGTASNDLLVACELHNHLKKDDWRSGRC